MALTTVGVIIRGPRVDGRLLALAETLFAAAHAVDPWHYSEDVLARAVARFRERLLAPGAMAFGTMHLPHGLIPPPAGDSLGRTFLDPTQSPGSSVVTLAHGHRIHGDLGAGFAGDFAEPAAGGSAWLVGVMDLPGRQPDQDLRLRILMHHTRELMADPPVERAYMLLPEGADPPELLLRGGWRVAGQVVDDLTGRSLDVHEGPVR